jgi:hypothetical protein
MAQSPVILLGGATSDVLKGNNSTSLFVCFFLFFFLTLSLTQIQLWSNTGRGSLQDIDQLALLKPHIKWYAHISRIADIVPALEKAFAISQEGTPGPVFIEFPLDTLYTPVSPQSSSFFFFLSGNFSTPKLMPFLFYDLFLSHKFESSLGNQKCEGIPWRPKL